VGFLIRLSSSSMGSNDWSLGHFRQYLYKPQPSLMKWLSCSKSIIDRHCYLIVCALSNHLCS
jgi:hypothetical protein